MPPRPPESPQGWSIGAYTSWPFHIPWYREERPAFGPRCRQNTASLTWTSPSSSSPPSATPWGSSELAKPDRELRDPSDDYLRQAPRLADLELDITGK